LPLRALQRKAQMMKITIAHDDGQVIGEFTVLLPLKSTERAIVEFQHPIAENFTYRTEPKKRHAQQPVGISDDSASKLLLHLEDILYHAESIRNTNSHMPTFAEASAIKTRAEWAITRLKATKRESVLPDPETLDKNETIDVIRRIQHEAMERAEPYQKRLAAYAMSEPPAPIVTEQGTYVYVGKLPAPPEVRRSDIEGGKP
jgi:hypothetical protein